MTHNQIEYQRHLENVRHNKVTEGQTDFSNYETRRHNVSGEALTAADISERRRHNIESEGINWYSARNLAGLQDAQAGLARSNTGVQAMANLLHGYEISANYAINSRNAQINQQNADTNARNAATSERRTNAQNISDLTASGTRETTANTGVQQLQVERSRASSQSRDVTLRGANQFIGNAISGIRTILGR